MSDGTTHKPRAQRGASLRRGWLQAFEPVVLFLGAAGAGLSPVADGDIYWHLAAGREIVRRRELLWTDPFSISAAERPWIDVHWLFQLGAYGVHALGGITALVIVKCLLVGSGALLMLAAVPRSARGLFVATQLAALCAARHLLLVRPVIVSLLLMAAFVLLLERFRRSGQQRQLYWLPALQVVWSNCQGLAALGPALIGAYALAAWTWTATPRQRLFGLVPEVATAGARRQHARALGFTLLASVAAWLITPYSARGAALSFELLHRLVPHAGNPYGAVAENVSPLAQDAATHAQFWHVPWFAAWLAVSFALSRRVLLSHALLLLGFGALALISNRNVLLVYWVAPLIAASQLAPRIRLAWLSWRRMSHTHAIRAWPHALSRVVLVGLLSLITAVASIESDLEKPVPFRFPTQSAEVLAQRVGSGGIRPGHTAANVFCADQQGGYLIFNGYPHLRPYIDTRLVLRTPEQFREYLRLADQPEHFDAFSERHAIAYAVLPVAYPDRYLQLIAHLYHSANWRLIYTDGAEVLFAHRSLEADSWSLSDPQTTARVTSRLAQRYAADSKLHDAALIQLGMLDMAVGAFAQAERVLSQSQSDASLSLRARALLAAGDLDGAQAIGEQHAAAESEDVRSLVLVAMVYARRGRLQHSLQYLQRALALDPGDAEALGLLATLEEQQHAH